MTRLSVSRSCLRWTPYCHNSRHRARSADQSGPHPSPRRVAALMEDPPRRANETDIFSMMLGDGHLPHMTGEDDNWREAFERRCSPPWLSPILVAGPEDEIYYYPGDDPEHPVIEYPNPEHLDAALQIFPRNGAWVGDVLDLYPDIKVSARHVVSVPGMPSSCDFLACNLNDDWQVARASQNLVMGIDICPSTRDMDQQCQLAYAALIPGGFFELRERAQPPDPLFRMHIDGGTGRELTLIMRRNGFEIIEDCLLDGGVVIVGQKPKSGKPTDIQTAVLGQQRAEEAAKENFVFECSLVLQRDLERARTQPDYFRTFNNSVERWVESEDPKFTLEEVQWAFNDPPELPDINKIGLERCLDIFAILGALLVLAGVETSVLNILKDRGWFETVDDFLDSR
ncbi:hypothetical protein NKR23_g8960 [Pleurostoma richardsiae]|uniref:Uncharacterized protein n=1 Tax=Pleurostoma richardsiae TaxID=41990 RepID=A0AA38RP85_9PEZI|nr:hypothetical protein NKR23_g8960 [Pleurostoma richardsiae]